MKGNNKLQLNGATMIEAVQEYLDGRLIASARVEVANVREHATEAPGAVFEITTVEPEPPDPKVVSRETAEALTAALGRLGKRYNEAVEAGDAESTATHVVLPRSVWDELSVAVGEIAAAIERVKWEDEDGD